MKVLVVGRTGVAGQATVADRACWGVLVIGMKTDVTYHQLCIQQPMRKRAGLSYGFYLVAVPKKHVDPNLNFFKSMFGDP